MKQLITMLFLLLLFSHCSDPQSVKEINKKKIQEKPFSFLDFELNSQKEKIFLLSVANNISYDTLYLILKTYNSKTKNNFPSTDNSISIYRNVIDSISINYNISKSKIASIIYNFKYNVDQENLDE